MLLTPKIIIADRYLIGFLQSCTIVSKRSELTDTALVKLPRKMVLNGEKADSIFKIGEKITIKLGYNGVFYDNFEGYIVKVNTWGQSVELQCQDEMWQLKKMKAYEKNQKNAFKNAKISDIIHRLIGNHCPVDCVDATLGSYSITQPTVAKELLELKNKGFYAYFKNKKLNVNLKYDLAKSKEVNFYFGKNILKNSLTVGDEKETPTKLIVTVIDDKMQCNKFEIGEDGGDTKTITYHLNNITDAKERAQSHYEKIKIEKIKGSFTTYGAPAIAHGDVVNVKNTRFLPFNFRAIVEGTEVNFGSQGYKRQIYIGQIL
jgi:hypothetical protein